MSTSNKKLEYNYQRLMEEIGVNMALREEIRILERKLYRQKSLIQKLENRIFNYRKRLWNYHGKYHRLEELALESSRHIRRLLDARVNPAGFRQLSEKIKRFQIYF